MNRTGIGNMLSVKWQLNSLFPLSSFHTFSNSTRFFLEHLPSMLFLFLFRRVCLLNVKYYYRCHDIRKNFAIILLMSLVSCFLLYIQLNKIMNFHSLWKRLLTYTCTNIKYIFDQMHVVLNRISFWWAPFYQ